MAPLLTFIEGLVSYHDYLSMVTTTKVPGAGTGPEALRKLTFEGKGMVSDFTRRVPLGLTGPFGLSGRHLKDPFEIKQDGTLTLTEAVKGLFKKYKTSQVKARDFHSAFEGRRGTCPFAFLFRREEGAGEASDTGLQMLAEAYWEMFQRVDKIVDEFKVHIDATPLKQAMKRRDILNSFR